MKVTVFSGMLTCITLNLVIVVLKINVYFRVF